eukprot:scaffold113521_cov36-Phaeocystis_antarctica.AAC.1
MQNNKRWPSSHNELVPGNSCPFAALLGPDWIRTRGRAPSCSVGGSFVPAVGRTPCLTLS